MRSLAQILIGTPRFGPSSPWYAQVLPGKPSYGPGTSRYLRCAQVRPRYCDVLLGTIGTLLYSYARQVWLRYYQLWLGYSRVLLRYSQVISGTARYSSTHRYSDVVPVKPRDFVELRGTSWYILVLPVSWYILRSRSW